MRPRAFDRGLPLLSAVLLASACGGDNSQAGSTGSSGGSASTSSTTASSSTGSMSTSGMTPTTTAGSSSTSSATTTTTTATTGSTTSTSSTSSTTSPGSTGTTGGDGCTVVTVTGDLSEDAPGSYSTTMLSPPLGDASMTDRFILALTTNATGTFDLTSFGVNDNAQTCEQCVRIHVDEEGPNTQFFPATGTIHIDATSQPLAGGWVTASLEGVSLVEVTIDANTGESTPVPDGACLDIADGVVSTPAGPPGWACDPARYGDGTCDCGCGAVDSDCLGSGVGACDACDDLGSCSTDACPGTIDDTDNSTCTGSPSDTLEAGPGLGLPIPDDGYDGAFGSMACVDLPLAADGIDTVASVQLVLGVDHTWIGDLVIKVVSPQGTVVTAMSRPGLDETVDDGTGAFGDSSNIAASSPVTFRDAGATDAEQMGSTIGGGMVVCADDGLCDYAPDPGAATPGDFSGLVGEDAVGTWHVCVGDAYVGDTGAIDHVQLVVGQM